MKTVALIQSSPEWHAHRAQHWNASDAPAMLGVSPHKSRSELLREYVTGIGQEFDEATQRRFDDGHRFEAQARQVAEQIIGEDLYPVTGVNGRYSASFDGITLLEDVAWEHKTINNEIRLALESLPWDPNNEASDLPEHYRVQMEHQLMVSGAARVLFMATKWDANGNLIENLHCWYYPDQELRARIVAGWGQFERDLAGWAPEPDAVKPVAAPVEGFGALALRIEGRVIASNLDAFKAGAEQFIARLPKAADLLSDQDFADAEEAVKACEEAEQRARSARDSAQAQMADIDAAFRLVDHVIEMLRSARIPLTRAISTAKENRRAEIVAAAVRSVGEHYASINAELGKYAINPPQSLSIDIGAAIKGKRSLANIKDAAETAAASAKIRATQRAEVVRVNIQQIGTSNPELFPDDVSLVTTKTTADLQNLIYKRISEHAKREEAKLEAERERIRAEEKASPTGAPEAQQPLHGSANNAGLATGSRNEPASESVTLGSLSSTLISNNQVTLDDINTALSPMSITEAGLASIGIKSVDRFTIDEYPHEVIVTYAAGDLRVAVLKLASMLIERGRQTMRGAA